MPSGTAVFGTPLFDAPERALSRVFNQGPRYAAVFHDLERALNGLFNRFHSFVAQNPAKCAATPFQSVHFTAISATTASFAVHFPRICAMRFQEWRLSLQSERSARHIPALERRKCHQDFVARESDLRTMATTSTMLAASSMITPANIGTYEPVKSMSVPQKKAPTTLLIDATTDIRE